MLISVGEPRRVFHLNKLIRHYTPHIFLLVGSIQMFLSQERINQLLHLMPSE